MCPKPLHEMCPHVPKGPSKNRDTLACVLKGDRGDSRFPHETECVLEGGRVNSRSASTQGVRWASQQLIVTLRVGSRGLEDTFSDFYHIGPG